MDTFIEIDHLIKNCTKNSIQKKKCFISDKNNLFGIIKNSMNILFQRNVGQKLFQDNYISAQL